MNQAGEEKTDGGRLREEELDAAQERIGQLEADLREQQSMLRAVFNGTPDIFVLKDTGSVYRMVNPAFCRFLGKREEEIVGRTDYDLFPAADAENYIRGDGEVMRTLEPQARGAGHGLR